MRWASITSLPRSSPPLAIDKPDLAEQRLLSAFPCSWPSQFPLSSAIVTAASASASAASDSPKNRLLLPLLLPLGDDTGVTDIFGNPFFGLSDLKIGTKISRWSGGRERERKGEKGRETKRETERETETEREGVSNTVSHAAVGKHQRSIVGMLVCM